METQLEDNQLIVETIRALWRKRELDGALALIVRIPNALQRKLWEATIIIAKAELSGDFATVNITTQFFDDVISSQTDQESIIDTNLVRGRIAIVRGDYVEAEDFFFKSLLQSREDDYLLGKVESMIGLGRIKLLNNNFEQALDLVITADSLTEKLSKTKRKFVKGEVLLLRCLVYLSVQDYESLESSAQELLSLSEEIGETHKYLHALNHIAVVYASRGDLKTAMPFFLEALDICKIIDYQNLAAKISTNIATIHGQLQNFDEALNRYHFILDEYTTPIRLEEKAFIYNNIGNLYIRLEEWKKAVSYFIEAEAIADKKDHKPLKRLAFCQIARCLVESKSYNALLTHLKTEEDVFEGHPDNGLQILHFVKAKYAFTKKEYPETIHQAKLAINLATQFNDDTTTLHALNVLAKAYEEKGDLVSALEIYKKHQSKKEELERERSSNRITNTEIDYIIAAKENEIESLQRENALQSELIKSTSVISRKNKELIAKNKELSYFARMIAVDFNENLRVISQFIPLLEKSIETNQTKKTTEYFSFIKKAVSKVSGLIDGLHKYAFIIEDKKETKNIKTKELFQLIEHDLKLKIKSTQAQITYDNNLPETLCGKSQLRLIFKEIFENALRFTESPPKIEVSYSDQDDSHLFTIKDYGIGIPKADEKKMFWAFYRSNRLSTQEGKGLGLAACKSIIEKHGGSLRANNRKEGGLSISIFWPKECNQLSS